jgi:uncharacterized protein (DUF2252 family)
MSTRETATGSFLDREWRGRDARRRAPRSGIGEWSPAPNRTDPIATLERQAGSRVADLVPIRYSRMLASPFAFYRGAAAIMAADLAGTPDSAITVQLCGDAHLSNFGLFGTPERSLVFDIDDFDETLPGPWEWDVERLAASFEVAARSRGFSPSRRRAITRTVGRAYRERMRAAADATVLSAWYDRLDAESASEWVRAEHEAKRTTGKVVERTEGAIARARTRDSIRAVGKLVTAVDGGLRLRAEPPLIVPLADLTPPGHEREDLEQEMRDLLWSYQGTLIQRNHPMHEFTFVDMARKVVGVGSVGTRAWVVLLRGRDDADPLLLQAKEAEASVLEQFLGTSDFENHAERVVRGQRLMQAASDIFLGWQRVPGFDGVARDFYIRQLHDWKGSADVETMTPTMMRMYARICGETLARAHSRAGDRVAIAAYLGASDRFDRALSRFAERYADQNEADFAVFSAAVASGRLAAALEDGPVPG